MGRGEGTRVDRRRAMVNRGEVWWAEHQAAGRRPYLIITRQAAVPVLVRVLAVPATRTIRGIPSEVVLDEDDGMPDRCALSFDNIQTMPLGLFTERICRLGVDRLEQVCRALNAATAC
jgi:mRNA interferase MazF